MTAKYKLRYKYDTKTREFQNQIKIQENQKRPGEFLIPPENSMAAEPKPVNENQKNIANEAGDDWLIVPDYRGREYYLPDGSYHKIEKLGEELPADALNEPPPPPIDQVAQQKLAEINSTADALLQPVTSTYPNTEIISWDKQEIEARRWQSWNDFDQAEPVPDTPLIDNILFTRTDISKPDLITRIIEKANAYAATGQIFGIRHNLEAELEIIMADGTLSDDEKREAIAAINVNQAYSAISL